MFTRKKKSLGLFIHNSFYQHEKKNGHINGYVRFYTQVLLQISIAVNVGDVARYKNMRQFVDFVFQKENKMVLTKLLAGQDRFDNIRKLMAIRVLRESLKEIIEDEERENAIKKG